MAKLIYIKSSPRDRSHSSLVARKFLESYQESHPQDKVEELDLWKMDLPSFDRDTINAKYALMHQKAFNPEQEKAWNHVKNIFKQFTDADKYLLSVPMWNFGIPYRLKHYIDILTQPGLAFNVTPQGGYVGLVTGKPAMIIIASGGMYRPGSGSESYDMERPYLKLWLQFIGFKDIKEITVDGTMGDPAKAKEIQDLALKEAAESAKKF
jgi:FMN-dependent NADH-azoreductase